MKQFFAPILASSLSLVAACPAAAQQAPSPYQTRFAVEAPVIVAEGAVSGFGIYRSMQRDGLTDAELAALNKDNIPSFDRFSAGYYSKNFQTAGDLLCYPTLVIAPGLLALNPAARGRYGQVVVLYIETIAAADAFFTTAIGNIPRYRPYLYGSEGGDLRNGHIATNSFFAGHTAHTAAATFFAAKVFHDFNPNSRAQPYVWTAAALLPAVVAYTRIEAGKHFLSDNLVGYAVGATMGVVVPQLHKAAGRRGLSLVPLQGVNVNGYSYSGLLLRKQL
ncbi:phosphatase PAP2 family protein [Hymenobacter cheonanensis]|uniref:phosphatase PAP2 family protein n=1 Tax=Hymenobacter sp. CA2-7 TaxID=3063993 RepID=UPI002713315F|nr:phosphatase PAP2 family protein [Hymenobacter sp. CA2-7]MDO7886551.1 phosphatase PAP2 family protein [Hymenobacter sp. CA2-7]